MEFKNSMGNGGAKELVCTSHGHELRWGNAGGRGGYWAEGEKGEKNETSVVAKSMKNT